MITFYDFCVLLVSLVNVFVFSYALKILHFFQDDDHDDFGSQD